MLRLAFKVEKRLDGVTARWVPCVEHAVKERPIVSIHHTPQEETGSEPVTQSISGVPSF